MAFTDKQAKEWLEKVYAFSQSPDEKTYHELVEEAATKENVYCNSLQLKGEQHVKDCAQRVAEIFYTMTITQPLGGQCPFATPHSTTWTYEAAPEGPIIRVFYSDHSKTTGFSWSLAAGTLHIMSLLRFRTVGICKVCKKPTFTTKPKTKVFCSPKCKQKDYRDRNK